MDRATKYAEDVVNGRVIACKPHIQACKRHLDNLAQQGTKEFPYIWRPEQSEKIINFAETLTIAEGKEPKPLKLYDFQCFDLGVPMGWYNNRGFRRFRRKYKSVSRQNGKTFENGITGTYISGFGGYQYGKLFTVATKHAQAKLAWEEIAKFIDIDPELGELYKVQEYKTLITNVLTNCTIEALSKERSLDDGFRGIFNSIDEIHQHKDNSIYKAIYNGTRALDETLTSMITTRGRDLNGFCHEMDTYCLNILNGSAAAEDFFVDIYTLDPEDDYFDESIWIKSNPILARTESGMEQLKRDAETARDMGGQELADFLTKCLNIWVQNADNQYIDVDKFMSCGSEKGLEAFRGQSCWVGLDLSSGGDLTSLALEFEQDNDRFYFYSHSFMPRGRLQEHIKTDIAPYDVWERDELITVTGTMDDYKNDYRFIVNHLAELQRKYDLNFYGIGVDPHNADGILSELEGFGCPVIIVTQSARNLSDTTDDLRLNVKSEKIDYDKNNSLLVWSFVNAKITKNSFDEIKVDKEAHAKHRRIDPVDACIDAHYMIMKNRKIVDVDVEMEKYLEHMGWA